MPAVGPVPMFHELPVIVNIHEGIPLAEARIVMAAIHGLVRRYAETDRKVDEFADAVPPLVAEYGLTARLVGRAREAIEFEISRQ